MSDTNSNNTNNNRGSGDALLTARSSQILRLAPMNATSISDHSDTPSPSPAVVAAETAQEPAPELVSGNGDTVSGLQSAATLHSGCGCCFPTSPRSAALPVAQQQYNHNWGQVVLGATSGIVFVIVVSIAYALYMLTQPYRNSITSGILLSIVLHPRSQLRSSLYMGTCVTRMQRVHNAWAQRGRFHGVVGSWLSLRHFISFVVMQSAFFFGLHKIRVSRRYFSDDGGNQQQHQKKKDTKSNKNNNKLASESRDVHDDHDYDDGGNEDGKDMCCTVCGKLLAHSNKISPLIPPTTKRRRSEGSSHTNTNTNMCRCASGPLRTTASSSSSSSDTPVLLIASPRGRRFLRWLTAAVVLVVGHALVGITYIALLHAALFFVFCAAVTVMPSEGFVIHMGRLWRIALIVLFVMGLSYNLAVDVISISGAVRRTTSAVVRVGNNNYLVPSPVAVGALPPHVEPVAHDGEEGPPCAASVSLLLAEDCSAVDNKSASADGSCAKDASAGVESLSDMMDVLIAQHKDHIQLFLMTKIQEHVVNELADMFNQTNATAVALEVLGWITPWLNHSTDPSESSSMTGTSMKKSKSASTEAQQRDNSLWGRIASFLLKFNTTAYYTNATGTNSSNLSPSTGHGKNGSLSGVSDTSSSSTTDAVMPSVSDMAAVNWLGLSGLLARWMLPVLEYAVQFVIRLGANLMNLFDSVYAAMLFVFFFRYLLQLDHTVLYYCIAKLLKALQPEYGEYHARNIEREITGSFITLLQSFWHLAWFHFCITFCVYKLLALPTPFLFALVSVILSLFPLVPKWLSPCSIAWLAVFLNTTSYEGIAGAMTDFRMLSLLAAVVLDYSDEWLLRVSRGLRSDGSSASANCDAVENGGVSGGGGEREQLQPFVVGTALVLGFVAYGVSGIVIGPLTVIVAKVLFDNWDSIQSASSSRYGRTLAATTTTTTAVRESPSPPTAAAAARVSGYHKQQHRQEGLYALDGVAWSSPHLSEYAVMSPLGCSRPALAPHTSSFSDARVSR